MTPRKERSQRGAVAKGRRPPRGGAARGRLSLSCIGRPATVKQFFFVLRRAGRKTSKTVFLYLGARAEKHTN